MIGEGGKVGKTRTRCRRVCSILQTGQWSMVNGQWSMVNGLGHANFFASLHAKHALNACTSKMCTSNDP